MGSRRQTSRYGPRTSQIWPTRTLFRTSGNMAYVSATETQEFAARFIGVGLACCAAMVKQSAKMAACGVSCPAVSPGSPALFRTAAIEQYGIEGEEMNDWGLGICCGPLVVCQTAAEHEERNNPRT